MTGSIALDVVIGLVFVYLLYSLLATIIVEAIANVLGFRAKFLEKAVIRMLEDGNVNSVDTFWRSIGSFFSLFGRKQNLEESKLYVTDAFFKHPLLKYLAEDEHHSKPSYLTAQNFSKALIDLLRGEKFKAGEDPRPVIEETLFKEEGALKWMRAEKTENQVKLNKQTLSFIRSLWADSQGDVTKFKLMLEEWFDATMERTTGWYKKHTQGVLLIIGLLIAIIFNVDSLKIADRLSKDPVLREQIVKQADNYLKAHQSEINEYQVQKDSQTTKDSNSISPNFAQIKRTSDSLIDQASNLIRKDIAEVNHTLSIGWECSDTANYRKHLAKCGNKKCSCQKHTIGNHRHISSICITSNSGYASLIGWVITALALSLGAPFWFDMLNKLMKLRGSIKEGTETTISKKSDNISPLNREA